MQVRPEVPGPRFKHWPAAANSRFRQSAQEDRHHLSPDQRGKPDQRRRLHRLWWQPVRPRAVELPRKASRPHPECPPFRRPFPVLARPPQPKVMLVFPAQACGRRGRA
ncbi:hypothetical protein GCM10011316_33760 [Roseibium aquae]|uniref:Uncharacterized protein n=1 Tax=Roseibium aquae TaxID=1323746 RepID=A0A916TM06_9HYPH|nr:hypothetical protein GCM10011316_33760 [Roseibium aquae]